ncbi:Meiotic recombination protein REC114 [Microtus ochrogaster]|uniref:Meiotic recombination protein REC114 n=1 Tax=Microtus ochrogaster TaxID=79684 RepID=A0A8J6GNX1_MICOH|nr:Meiotic recombination protein REC114 [Microtus ochrogaster]
MAEAGNVRSGLGLPGEVSQWPLKRYGRFMLLDTRESPGPSSEGAAASSPSWKMELEDNIGEFRKTGANATSGLQEEGGENRDGEAGRILWRIEMKGLGD